MAELEKFILEHGEHVVDVLGAEVDRMERSIKVFRVIALCLLKRACSHIVLYFVGTSSRSPSCGSRNSLTQSTKI